MCSEGKQIFEGVLHFDKPFKTTSQKSTNTDMHSFNSKESMLLHFTPSLAPSDIYKTSLVLKKINAYIVQSIIHKDL